MQQRLVATPRRKLDGVTAATTSAGMRVTNSAGGGESGDYICKRTLRRAASQSTRNRLGSVTHGKTPFW